MTRLDTSTHDTVQCRKGASRDCSPMNILSTFQPLIYNLGNSKIRLQRPLVIAAIIFVLIFLVYFWTAKTASSPDLTHNPNKLPPALEYDATYPLTRYTSLPSLSSPQKRNALSSETAGQSSQPRASSTGSESFQIWTRIPRSRKSPTYGGAISRLDTYTLTRTSQFSSLGHTTSLA